MYRELYRETITILRPLPYDIAFGPIVRLSAMAVVWRDPPGLAVQRGQSIDRVDDMSLCDHCLMQCDRAEEQ